MVVRSMLKKMVRENTNQGIQYILLQAKFNHLFI